MSSRSSVLRASVTALVTSLGFLVPSAGEAQTYAATVWSQLDAMFTQVEAEGYASRNYIIGRLNQDESEIWTINFFAGNTYRITGACDGDCEDIDLVLLNSGGAELDSDLLVDDVPILNYAPKSSGAYSIKVIMARCSQDPCYFGLGVFFR